MSSDPFFSSNESQKRWVKHTIANYDINLDIQPVVFSVPQSLRDTKPQAYTPQVVGLGPYHHLRPWVQEMESKKRAAVHAYIELSMKKAAERAEIENFTPFVEIVEDMRKGGKSEELKSEILAYYDRYLDLDTEALAWMIAIDGIFLIHFLKEESNWGDQRLVADIMMLENQIPSGLLKKIAKVLSDKGLFPGALEMVLPDKLYSFCDRQSPLRLSAQPRRKKGAFQKQKHMLDFLYHLIVNNFNAEGEPSQEGDLEVPKLPAANSLSLATSKVRAVANGMVEIVTSGIKQARIQGLKVPDNFEKVSKLLNQLKNTSDLYDNSDKHDQCRLADKIDVPSVSQLYHIAKIKISLKDGGIRNICFDETENILYLPEITLGETSEVLLRNLLTYEAAAKQGSNLELAEYVDLMCGIIDAEFDVKLLREVGIIKGDLPDDEIVRIFNGINKSTQRPDEKSEVQQIVKTLKTKFDNLLMVKVYKFMDKSFAALQSWIKRLFPILVLMLLSLQFFCETYGCGSRRLGYAAVPASSSFSLESEAKLMMPRKFLGYDHTLLQS